MGQVKIKPSFEVRIIGFFLTSLIVAALFFHPFSPEFVAIAFLTAIATAIGSYAAQAAFVAGASATTVQAVGYTAYALTYVAGSVALQAASRALSKELRDNQRGGESLGARTRTTRQPVEPRRVIYGRSKVGGTIVFMDVTDDNKHLHMVVTIADHEVKEFVDIYLDDNKLSLTGNLDVEAEINDVSTGNDQFIVNGKRTADISDGDTITVDGTETKIDVDGDGVKETTVDNNGDYTVDGSPTYDSANNETTITVVEDVKNDTNGNGTVTYTIENIVDNSSRYDGKAVVRKHSGKDSQTADELLLNQSGKWDSDNRLRGVAYFYVRLEWDRNTFIGGGVPNVSAVVDGKNNIFDPRDNSTGFTDNPALCIRDYLLDDRRGLGATTDEVNDEVVKTSANTCEESISLKGGGTQERYTLDGTIKLDQRPMDIIRDMNSAMDGTTVYTNGEYHIIAGEYESPVLELDESDLRASFTLNTKQSKRNTFNRIKGVYVSPENDWQPTDFPPIKDSTALANDNGEKRWKDIELPFTTNPARAQRLAKYDLARNRQQKVFEGTFGLRAMELVVDDVFEFTFDRYGWDKKQFRVQQWSFVITESEDSPSLAVKIVAQETDSSVYAWDPDSDEQQVSNAPESTLADPSNVAAPTNLNLNSGDNTLLKEDDGTIVPRIHVTWNQPTDEFVTQGGQIEVQFRQSSNSQWETDGFVAGDRTEHFISSVKSDVDYDVRIRSVSTFGFTSSWTQINNHTVIGKTALPPNVSIFQASQNGEAVNLSWSQVTESDLDGYIIKYGEQGDSDWESARILTEVAAGTAITSQQVPPGDYTFYIKAEDTSGNQSSQAATSNLEVINDFDIIHQREYAPDWEDFTTGKDGILETGAWGLEAWGNFSWGASGPSFDKHWTGELVPTDSKEAASDYSNFEVFDQFVPNPVSVSGYQGQEHDVGTNVTARLYGSITGAFGPGESGQFTPILQVDARKEGENFDGFENWTVGTKTGRYFKFRVKLINKEGSVSYLNGFQENVDAEERTESGSATIDSNGDTITFNTPFVNKPFITISVPSSDAKIANPDQVTAVDFVAHVFDSTGTEVGGDIEWTAEGV